MYCCNIRHSIAKTLKSAFMIGLSLVLIMSAISLFSWYNQTKQVNYILDDYFPKTNLALKLEENMQQFINDLNKLASIKTNLANQTITKQLYTQLNEMQLLAKSLFTEIQRTQFNANIQQFNQLIEKMSKNTYQHSVLEQQRQNFITKIQWLNDDFNNELIALYQEIHWQQQNIAGLTVLQKNELELHLQQQLQTISQLSVQQGQIKNELLNFLYQLNPETTLNEYNDFRQLITQLNHTTSQISDVNIIPLKQMIDSLWYFIESDNELKLLVTQLVQLNISQQQLLNQQQQLVENNKQMIEAILSQTKAQFNQLNQQLREKTQYSGIFIILFLAISLLFMGLFNQLYVKKSITKRFAELIAAVKDLNLGKMDTHINTQGRDELSQIAKLLKSYTKTVEERIAIEQSLRQTQDELIQAAKLAVVGQTMTSLAHEINQPLNALNIYLFSLKKAIGDNQQAVTYTEKMAKLIERISYIIKGLRHFSRKIDGQYLSEKIYISQSIYTAWELLENQHLAKKAELIVKGDQQILGNAILLEQVFVNILTNALDACPVNPKIEIDILHNKENIQIFIRDNGIGWSQEDADKLLKPFYTNKEIGLGLGLTICQTIMEKLQGYLSIASTLEHNALVILTFPLITTKENKNE